MFSNSSQNCVALSIHKCVSKISGHCVVQDEQRFCCLKHRNSTRVKVVKYCKLSQFGTNRILC
jgi:hypothetical protein